MLTKNIWERWLPVTFLFDCASALNIDRRHCSSVVLKHYMPQQYEQCTRLQKPSRQRLHISWTCLSVRHNPRLPCWIIKHIMTAGPCFSFTHEVDKASKFVIIRKFAVVAYLAHVWFGIWGIWPPLYHRYSAWTMIISVQRIDCHTVSFCWNYNMECNLIAYEMLPEWILGVLLSYWLDYLSRMQGMVATLIPLRSI